MRRKTKKVESAKDQVRSPDLEYVKSAVLVSLRSPESQRSYRRSIENFVCWYCSEPCLSFNNTVVTRYRIHLEDQLLAPGTINVRLAAVRRLAYEAAETGLLSPEFAAGIRRDLYQESRRAASDSFPPRYVRDDSARAHVKHKRERYAENRNNQHGLPKASGAESFRDRG
jgi:hypothetical protein